MRFARRHSIVVTVALPCSEAWAQMTPTDQGRHCAACAQEVVDFTRYTDAELLAWFRQPGHGATCGRFRLDQLARPLRHPPPPVPRWRSWLAALVALWAWREAAPPAAPAQQRPTQHLVPRPVALRLPPLPMYLRGQLMAADLSVPLAGAVVQLAGTDIQTSTDRHGRFTLLLPTPLAAAGQPWQLTLQAVGYTPRHLPAPAVHNQQIALFRPPSAPLTYTLGRASVQAVPIRELPTTTHGQPALHLEDWLR